MLDGDEGVVRLREALRGSEIQLQAKDYAGNRSLSPVWSIAPHEGEAPAPAPEETPSPPLMPDLVVWGITAEPAVPREGNPVTVTLKVVNQGDGDAGGFWVELYADPAEEPTLNSICTELGKGAFWYVAGLEAGEATTLTTDPVPITPSRILFTVLFPDRVGCMFPIV